MGADFVEGYTISPATYPLRFWVPWLLVCINKEKEKERVRIGAYVDVSGARSYFCLVYVWISDPSLLPSNIFCGGRFDHDPELIRYEG